jgi:hypothetical protein
MTTVTFFANVNELSQITGLTAGALWSNGFNLDDMDFGFVSDTEWLGGWFLTGSPYYQNWLLTRMDDYCAGYQHVEYKNKHYYMLYHS